MEINTEVVCVSEDSLGILVKGDKYTIEKLQQLGTYHGYEIQCGLVGIPYYLFKLDRFEVLESNL